MSDEATTGPLHQRARPHFAKAALFTVVVLLLLYFFSGIRVIGPDEQALVLRLGKKMTLPLLPGTHYTLPYPIDRVYIHKPNEVKNVSVGLSDQFVHSAARGQGVSRGGTNVGPEFLTGDENIIHLELNVQYQIGDPAAYHFRTIDTERLIVVACDNALTAEVASTHVDDILTSGRHVLSARVKASAQTELDHVGAGVSLISINLAKTIPPTHVAAAFKDVASALEDHDRLINEASGQYNEAIPEARGEAMRIVQEALADRNGKIKRAQGESARFLKTLQELEQTEHPELAILRLYLESMEQLMPKTRKYVIDTRHVRAD